MLLSLTSYKGLLFNSCKNYLLNRHYLRSSGYTSEQKIQKLLSSRSLHSSRIDKMSHTGKLCNSLGDETFYRKVIKEILCQGRKIRARIEIQSEGDIIVLNTKFTLGLFKKVTCEQRSDGGARFQIFGGKTS